MPDNQMPQVNLDNPMVKLLGTTAEVTQQVTQGATQALNRASETVQGISQLNAQTISGQGQALSAMYLAKAQQYGRENPWKAIGEGVFKASTDYLQAEDEKNKVKAQNLDAEARRNKELEQRNQDVDNLNARTKYQELYRSYQQGGFRDKGTGSFINDVQDSLNSLKYVQTDTYARVLDDAYSVSGAFDASVQRQASEAQAKLEVAVGDKRKQEYLGLTLQVTSKLANALNTEQAANGIQWFEANVLKPISEDSTLTPIQKIETATKMLATLQEQGLAKKYQNYEEYQRVLREYSVGMPELQQAVAQFTSDNDLLKLGTTTELLFQKYPKLRNFYRPPGTIQEDQLKLRKLGIEQQTLDAAEREKNPLILDNAATSALGAAVILDPSFLASIENSEVYATNKPLINQVRQIRDEFSRYNQAKAQLDLKVSQSNEELAKLEIATVQDVFRLQKDFLNPTGQSPEQRAILEQQYRLLNIPPDVIAQAQQGNEPDRLAAQGIIRNQIEAKKNSLTQLRNARVEVINRERDVVNESFPILRAFGLLGKNEAELRQIYTNNRPSLQQAVDAQAAKIQELKQRNFQNNSLQGQTGNFNQGSQSQEASSTTPYSGTLATVTDGKQTIAVAPLRLTNGARSFPLTGRFLEQRETHKHAGVDYAVPVGTEVISPLGGKVIQLNIQRNAGGQSTGYGLYITVKQDDGKVLRYGHLSGSNVQIDQRVEPGQSLGRTGGDKGHPTSGSSSGAHLHLEVRTDDSFGTNSSLIDPIKYFQELYRNNPTGNAAPSRQVRQDNAVFNQNQIQANQPVLALGNNRILLPNNNSISAEDALSVKPPTKAYYPEQDRFFSKKPIPRVFTPPISRGQRNDPDANYNYAYLAANPTFRRKLAQVADELGTEAVFLADIISQESKFTPNLMHSGSLNNVGLIGFGRTSFGRNPPANRRTEALISLSAVQQLDVVKEYLLANTSATERKRVDTMWSAIRLGWNDRARFRKTLDYSIRPNGDKTFGEELELLGKYAGRRYAIPNIQRRSSITPNTRAYFASSQDTPFANQLAKQQFNFVATTGDINNG